MSPSHKYGRRVTTSTSSPTLWNMSSDRFLTCSSQVVPFKRMCSAGRTHLPPKHKCGNYLSGPILKYVSRAFKEKTEREQGSYLFQHTAERVELLQGSAFL